MPGNSVNSIYKFAWKGKTSKHTQIHTIKTFIILTIVVRCIKAFYLVKFSTLSNTMIDVGQVSNCLILFNCIGLFFSSTSITMKEHFNSEHYRYKLMGIGPWLQKKNNLKKNSTKTWLWRFKSHQLTNNLIPFRVQMKYKLLT